MSYQGIPVKEAVERINASVNRRFVPSRIRTYRVRVEEIQLYDRRVDRNLTLNYIHIFGLLNYNAPIAQSDRASAF